MGQPAASRGRAATPTLGKAMLNKYARAFFTRVLTPFAAFLIRRGVSPDTVTLLGTAGVIAGALVFYPRGEFFWGTIVITLFVFSDLVDGNMARQLGRTSRWGAFLDSTLDRVADGAIFGGFALWYAGNGDDNVLCAVSIFCLASGQVVSYTKARGESIGLPVAVNGLVERAERLVISLVAAGLAGLHTFGVPGIQVLLPIALWIVAVGSLVTLIQRVVTVRRESAEAEAAAAQETPESPESQATPESRGHEAQGSEAAK
ncbi:phosphatidylinositol phosphate synthase [Streptomyces sp. Root1310]|uniref:phosphatidylinositol phosphate synthase n=1 Tax=Streptomyces sp. Root1310 TaxID=1736452 RepID=UPI00070DD3FA|nr:CDP-alcohol phosphatidyltransferase family protein [Streptomyces sp. Root1310]KQX60963.1 CDP-diacylglycerol--glycerol-3-phosphate 3-phosphatidyltransferase [Streptomyces sp. Root1310]